MLKARTARKDMKSYFTILLMPSGKYVFTWNREQKKSGLRQWHCFTKAQKSDNRKCFCRYKQYLGKSFKRATTTLKKKESNWKSLYYQITCHVLEITEFVKELPLFQSCIFIWNTFLTSNTSSERRQKSPTTQNHTCSLGTNCLIMKRNLLFLTQFLTVFIPNY